MTEPMSSQTQEGAQTSTLTVTESEQPQVIVLFTLHNQTRIACLTKTCTAYRGNCYT